MDKRLTTYLVVAISLLAVLSIFTSGLVVGAQTATNSTLPNSTSIASLTSPEPRSNTTSLTQGSASTQVTSSSSFVSSTNNSSSSDTVTVTGTSTVTLNTSIVARSVISYTSDRNDSVTVTSTTTVVTSSSSDPSTSYSISFNPQYWFCTPVSVTFTGPLIESGYYGDTLLFQYFQYNPAYPSVLIPIFTDPGLTVTSDTINYWIGPNEYSQINFAYQPNIAVKVIDVTPKSSGYPPGLIFFQLTDTFPGGFQSCPYPWPAPEFDAQWLVIMACIALSLVVLRIRKR